MTSTNVTITILVDNNAVEGLIADHGLSFFIETENKRILFDAGQESAFHSNVRALGIDLSKTDILALSHGHFDHTGGIPQVLQRNPSIQVYGHPGIIKNRFSIRHGAAKQIQMPLSSIGAIQALPSEQLHWVRQPTFLGNRVGVTGPIPRLTDYEDTGGPFYLDPQGKHPDPIEDDLALWIHTETGLVVCVGCAHAGLVNTLHYIKAINNGQRIRAVLGGFHLLNASPDRLEQTIAALRRFEPDVVLPLHCTGERAVTSLRDSMGERVSPGAAGMAYLV
jgi:7,8-dihydropterin-6-yl-methyl-4-(beta-D-ribofuranosyl)aminobenzene 5'-phosphate synthase